MLLNKFLSEDASFGGMSQKVQIPEALSEANWITPDSIGLALIKSMDNSYDNKLSEGMIFANILGEAAVLRGQDPTMLLEGAMGDFFSKMVKALKDAWQRMVTWFKNLFKSISIQMIDVKKALKGVDTILNPKEFKDFEYDGHEWVDNGGGIADHMGSAMSKNADEINSGMDKIIKTIGSQQIASDKNEHNREVDDKANQNIDNSENIKEFIGTLVGGKDASLEEAKDIIRKKYGYDDTFTSKKGLTWKPMVDYMNKFENNKVLNEARNKCNELYSKAIGNAEKALKATQAAQGKVKNTADNIKNSNAYFNSQVRRLQSLISLYKAHLSNYDSLMGTCIEMEKSRFTEYRGIIAKAVRYNSKKEK